MKIISVNVASLRTVTVGRSEVQSGVYKLPVESAVAVAVGEAGLEGDSIGNRTVHGGPDQAVYLYGSLDGEWWRETYGELYDQGPGFFGENLTVKGLASAEVAVGERFSIGSDVVLEATGPRMPCATMGSRSGDPEFVRRFLAAGRPGVYCRVIREGDVAAGMAVEPERFAGADRVTMAELAGVYYQRDLGGEALDRLLSVPLGERLVAKFTKLRGR